MADNLSSPTEPGFQTSPEIQPASLTIEDALRRDDFNFAERHLESYRNEYGETPHYLYFLARVKIGLKLFREANELLKTLYLYCTTWPENMKSPTFPEDFCPLLNWNTSFVVKVSILTAFHPLIHSLGNSCQTGARGPEQFRHDKREE